MTARDDDALTRAGSPVLDADDVLREIDMLALADAVGVYRSGPRELPTDLARRQAAAKRRAQGIDQRRRLYRAAQEVFGHPSPYPDPGRPSEAQLRELANELVLEHGFDPAYLTARYGLSRRTR